MRQLSTAKARSETWSAQDPKLFHKLFPFKFERATFAAAQTQISAASSQETQARQERPSLLETLAATRQYPRLLLHLAEVSLVVKGPERGFPDTRHVAV